MKAYLCILLGLFSIISCTSLKIKNVYKYKEVFGVPTVPTTMKYVFNIESGADFQINTIQLQTNENEKLIDKYAFINLKSQTGATIIQPNKSFLKGDYEISFTTEVNTSQNDIIHIKYTINQVQKIKQLIVHKKKTLVFK